jgi:YggT family protein
LLAGGLQARRPRAAAAGGGVHGSSARRDRVRAARALPRTTASPTGLGRTLGEDLMLEATFGIAQLLLRVLMYIIIAQAILSWLVAFNVINTYNDFVRSFLNALDRLTRPLYRPIRRILPDFGGIDFSPLVVLLIIVIIKDYLIPGAYASIVT